MGNKNIHLKAWEQKEEIYEYLGINFFRKLLVWTGWEKIIRKSFPVKNDAKALTGLYYHNYQAKKSEPDHLIILLKVLGLNVFVAFKFGVLKSS